MPSETDELLRSIRRWLKIAVFLLGVTLVALSNVGYTVAGYESGAFYATTGMIGGILALAAFLSVLTGAGNSNPAETANVEDGAD
jgi:hypothetical protein